MTLHRLSSSLLLAASLVLPLPAAQAASFSCSKATTPAERIICGDKDLGARDGLMARLFAAALRGEDRDKVRASQQSWHDALMACGNAACVKQSYDKRIFELIGTKGGRSATTEFHRGNSDRDQGSLVVAGPVDSADSLARKMGPVNDAQNLFYVLNNLYPGDPVTPGQAYKVVAVQ